MQGASWDANKVWSAWIVIGLLMGLFPPLRTPSVSQRMNSKKCAARVLCYVGTTAL